MHAKRGVAAAFEFQPLNVDIGHDELLFEPEASRFAEYPAVFGDDAVAGEHQIGGRFAEACRAVDVSREGAGRLLGHELTQVGVLAHRFGRRREVEDHLGAVEREVRRRRNGGPEVLADFDAEFRAVDPEREVRAEVGALFRDGDRLFRDAGAGCEPAVFVELRIVGDVGLGYDAQHTALRENDGAVVERRAVAQGGAGDDDQRQFARGFYQPRKGFVGRVEQRRQQQQVGAGVGRDGQFGKRDDLDAPLRGLFGHRGDPLGVEVAVADPYVRHRCRHFQKTEIIHRSVCCFAVFFAPDPRFAAGTEMRRIRHGGGPDCRRRGHMFIRPTTARGSGSPAGPCASW